MLHVPPTRFSLFLQAPLGDYDLFLVFFVSYILHSFDESGHEIGHPKHLPLVRSYLLFQLCYFPLGVANFENSLVFKRFKVFSKSPAVLI